MIDIKDKKFDPKKNFIYFSLFISFFPQLLAGPIERYKKLMPQLKILKSATPNNILDGVLMLMYGFLKLCLADRWGNYSIQFLKKLMIFHLLVLLWVVMLFNSIIWGLSWIYNCTWFS